MDVFGSTHLKFFDIIDSSGIAAASLFCATIFLTMSLSETIPIGLDSFTTTRKLMSAFFRIVDAYCSVFSSYIVITFFCIISLAFDIAINLFIHLKVVSHWAQIK